MLSLVLVLNVAVAVVGGRYLFRLTRNYIVWFFEFVFVLFFVGRPLLNYYLGLPDPGLLAFGIQRDVFVTYAACGLVFAIVFHPAVYWLFTRQRLFSDHFFHLCDYDDVSKRRFSAVFVGFLLLNYGINAFKFHSLGYVFSNQDSLEAGNKLEGGLWAVQMMSSVLIFPCLVLLARSLGARPLRLWVILLSVMAGFVAIVHPSDRTGVIGLLLAVLIYKFSERSRQGRPIKFLLKSSAVGAAVVVLMSLLNFLRMDQEFGQTGATTPFLSIMGGFWADTVPAANGMILIEYVKHHDWLYFRYLFFSLLPTSVIPSAIFPFKPRIDMEGILTYQIFGLHLDPTQFHEGGTLSYTVPIAGFADLGYFGVIVAALLYAFFFCVFLRGWRSKSVSVKYLTLYFLILVIAGFRLSNLGLAVISYWILLSTLLMFFATRFMARSQSGGHEVALAGRHDGSTIDRMLAICASVFIYILILLTYVLTSR